MIVAHPGPSAIPHNAGLLDLEHEAAQLTAYELIDQVSLLIEAPDHLRPYIMNRLRVVTYELQRRLSESEVAA
jgi:hypothetical protein